jgi:hypothetical protein
MSQEGARAAAQAAAHYNTSATVRCSPGTCAAAGTVLSMHAQVRCSTGIHCVVAMCVCVCGGGGCWLAQAGHVRQSMAVAQRRRADSSTAQLKKFHNRIKKTMIGVRTPPPTALPRPRVR